MTLGTAAPISRIWYKDPAAAIPSPGVRTGSQVKTPCLLVGCVALLLGGCRSHEDMCRHARDVSIRMLRADYAWGRKTVAKYEYDRLDAQIIRHVANVESKFVGVCLASAPPTRACLERIDEIEVAEREYAETRDACDLLEDKCYAPARKIRDEKVGDCKQPMKDLDDVLFEGVGEPR
jgi:hypothetical protein